MLPGFGGNRASHEAQSRPPCTDIPVVQTSPSPPPLPPLPCVQDAVGVAGLGAGFGGPRLVVAWGGGVRAVLLMGVEGFEAG